MVIIVFIFLFAFAVIGILIRLIYNYTRGITENQVRNVVILIILLAVIEILVVQRFAYLNLIDQ